MAAASSCAAGDPVGRPVQTPSGPLFVRAQGRADSPAVLLLHALGTDMSIWDGLADHLAGDSHVIRLDAPGHGRSPVWPAGALSLDSLAHAVWSVLDALAPGRVDMLGTSMGAVIALKAAAQAPQRVRRLVLCGAQLVRASTSADEMRQRSATIHRAGMGSMTETMIERWFPPRQDGDDSAAKEGIRRLMLRTTPEGYIACSDAMASYDLRGALQGMQDRTLLIAGAMDGEIPRHFADLQRQFGQSRFVSIADTGHFPHMQRPAEFQELISDYIGRTQSD